jgi:hypothetical protein
MIKILLSVAVLGSVGGFAGLGVFSSLAMAQGKQGVSFGSEVSAQCAHRRVMAPDPHNDCFRKLRSDAQLGYGQGGSSASSSDQRDEEQPKVSREQPETSTSPPETSTPPKVATVPAPKVATVPAPKVATVSAPKAKKASTPPRLDAQKDQQLYEEFLEWRNRRLFYAHTP